MTGTLWRPIEARNNIPDIKKHLFQLKIELSRLSKDDSSLLNQTPVFNIRGVELYEDE